MRRHPSRRPIGPAGTVLLAAAVLLTALPLIHVVTASFKSRAEIGRVPPTLLPQNPTAKNYVDTWRDLRLGRALFNTVLVSLGASALVVITSAMAGYAFAKKRFRGRDLAFKLILGSLILPPMVLMVPLFQIIKDLRLYDTLWGLILPFGATVFGVFFMRQFLAGIPDELLEAARVDGMSEWRIFWTIVIPLSRPALATLAIVEFVNNWNSFTMPLVLIEQTENYTAQLRLGLLLEEFAQTPWCQVMAAVVVSTLPIVALFLLLQRSVIRAAMSGALKG